MLRAKPRMTRTIWMAVDQRLNLDAQSTPGVADGIGVALTCEATANEGDHTRKSPGLRTWMVDFPSVLWIFTQYRHAPECTGCPAEARPAERWFLDL
jgi:hypothetical protein